MEVFMKRFMPVLFLVVFTTSFNLFAADQVAFTTVQQIFSPLQVLFVPVKQEVQQYVLTAADIMILRRYIAQLNIHNFFAESVFLKKFTGIFSGAAHIVKNAKDNLVSASSVGIDSVASLGNKTVEMMQTNPKIAMALVVASACFTGYKFYKKTTSAQREKIYKKAAKVGFLCAGGFYALNNLSALNCFMSNAGTVLNEDKTVSVLAHEAA